MTRKSPSRFKLVLFGVIAALVAFESALQVLAWVQWNAGFKPSARAAGDTRDYVLCVGDSFTFGLGATDPTNAYPAAAEREFARRSPGAPLRFVNAGWPGSDSQAVLKRLTEQLDSNRPRLVYVLVGYNDFWSQRETTDGFPIEFRTWRLITMLVAALRGGPDDVPVPSGTIDRASAAFLGEWHQGPIWVAFQSDGRIETSGGELPALWSADGEHLWLDMRDGSQRSEIRYRCEGDALSLRGGMFPEGVVLERGMPNSNALERGRAARMSGDHDKAESELRDAIEVPGLASDARIDLAELLGETGRASDGAALLLEAQREFDARPSTALGRRLVDAWLAVGRAADATRMMERLLLELPIDDALVQHIVRVGLRADDRAALDAAVKRAIQRGELSVKQRAGLLGLRPVLRDDDDQIALECLVEVARTATDDDPAFVRTIVWGSGRFRREAFVGALERLHVEGDERARLLAKFDAARASPDFTGERLTTNLRRIVQLCRAKGAEPVLLDYPADRPAVTKAADDVAAALGVGRLRLVEHFADLVHAGRREDWYVADGHCNDRGYVEMGRLVAEDVMRRMGQ